MNRLYRLCSKGIEHGTELSDLNLSALRKKAALGSIYRFPSKIVAPVQSKQIRPRAGICGKD